MKVMEMSGTNILANTHWRFREMKKSKVISLVLLLFLICALILSPSVAAQGGDPQDAIIKQVMKDTALHLGYSVSWDGTLVESPRTHYKYGVSSLDHRSNLIYLGAYSTESDAEFAWSQSKVTSEPVYTETFHGYDAFYIQSTLTRYHFYVQIGRFVLETHCVGCSGPDKLSADVLYNKALQHGLFPPGGTTPTPTPTPTPDSDGDGVPDDIDACLGTPAGVAVDDTGCPVGMQLSVSTGKKTYSPGGTVIVSGSVRDAKSGEPISGANVIIDINPKVSTTTDSSGNYKKNVTLPSDISQGTHTVTVTASKTGYPDVSKTTSFNVGGEFKVSLETDKENYAVGDVIKINGVVTSPDPIGSDLELNLEIRIYDSSGSVYRIQRTFIHSDGSYEEEIKIFGENKPGPWGQEGEIGKWRIEAIAKKTGYPDAKADKNIVVQGCGDQLCQNDKGEYCYNCSKDCKCDQGKICDPFSKYTNPKTKCSPKVAYIVVSSDVSVYELYWVLPRVNHMREYYRSRNYQTISILMRDKDEVFEALSYPSTKAIAYFGHAGVPSIEGSPAQDLRDNILYGILSKKYRALGLQRNEAQNKAKERTDQPNLDYAYIHTCHSLDDTSLANYLLRSNGTYWGERGILTSTCPLEKYVKP